ncbi:NfeD family protein, partial [Mesorhizobium sp.]
MFERIISELGPWVWMVLGFVLLVMEVIAPGIFMLWIGIAALLIGVVSLLIWDADFWTWQIQVLAFLAMSLVSTYVG